MKSNDQSIRLPRVGARVLLLRSRIPISRAHLAHSSPMVSGSNITRTPHTDASLIGKLSRVEVLKEVNLEKSKDK